VTSLQQGLLHIPWIVGVAGVLATYSYAGWSRTAQPGRVLHPLRHPPLRYFFYVSLLLFSVGQLIVTWVLSSPLAGWSTALWIVCILYCGALVFTIGRQWMRICHHKP